MNWVGRTGLLLIFIVLMSWAEKVVGVEVFSVDGSELWFWVGSVLFIIGWDRND